MIGTVSWTPIRLAPQPHWKTATTTPYAAPTPSTLRTAAFSGTSTERNTTISTRNDKPDHGAEEPRHPVLQARRDVVRVRAVAPVTDASDVGAAERRGERVLTQPLEQLAGAGVLR